MPTYRVDDEWLDRVAALGPEGQALANEARRDKRGRRKNPEFQYRRLARMWINFEKRSGRQNKPALRREFQRNFAKPIKALNLQIGRKIDPKDQAGPLRNEIARGNKERARIRNIRRSKWRIVPTFSLADAARGRRDQLIAEADYDQYLYLQAAAKAALFGGPGPAHSPLFPPT